MNNNVTLLIIVILILAAGSAVVIVTASGVVTWVSALALAVRGVAMAVARAGISEKE